ncbi:MAG TPA: hypothetical protein DIC34_07915 [Treponema sp.]|nr:MAG: hypothetical protein A2001_00355 [Treponema sp. GWC1_61_84]HCM26450.1 hypothetical protein [Treponema sp.]
MSSPYEAIVNNSGAFITLVNRDYVYEFANEPYCRNLNRSQNEVVGKSVGELWGEEVFRRSIKRHLDVCFAGQESHENGRFRFGDGLRDIKVSYYPYFDGGGITHAMVFSQDVTTVARLESKIMDLEYKDRVTGLFNRNSFDVVLEMEIDKAQRSRPDDGRVLMILSLENFGQVSAQHGHAIADIIMESISMKVKNELGSSDHLFRLDGAELAVLLTEPRSRSGIAAVAEGIVDCATFPYRYRKALIDIGCHIGIAVFPTDAGAKEPLVACALTALESAKSEGNPYSFFERKSYETTARTNRIRAELKKAIVDSGFEPYLQPIVDGEGRIAGAEALIRWNHSDLGPIPPSSFVPIAEESDDILAIGRWMLFRIIEFLKRNRDRIGSRYISVNLSAKEFSKTGLVEHIGRVLRDEGLSTKLLKIEITESSMLDDFDRAVLKIAELKDEGIETMIDDFGTGYSSLSYLKKLPASVIKIDKTFVDGIVEDETERNFLAGVVGLFRILGKRSVAEGVETEEQFSVLKELGVDLFQGYLFSKPLPLDGYLALLESEGVRNAETDEQAISLIPSQIA